MRTTLHCSELPRVISCPASLNAPEDALKIDETGEYAAVGTAVHELMAALVTGERLEIAVVAEKHSVDPDEAGPLYHMGRQLWERYAPVVTVLGAEVKGRVMHVLPDGTEIEVVGMCDVLAETGDEEGIVFDWKSGQIGRDYRAQVIAYAWQHGATKAVTVWLRDRVVDVEDVTGDDIAKLRHDIDRAYANPEKYSPSDGNCMYCPRRFEPCPALVQMQKATLAIFEGDTSLTPEQSIALYPRVQLLEKAIKKYRANVKELLGGANGPIATGDGREVCLAERTKAKLDAYIVWDQWVEGGGVLEELAPALSVSKTALGKLIGAKAERGQKGKQIQAFLDRLREAGGIETRTEKFIQVRKSLSCKKEAEDDG